MNNSDIKGTTTIIKELVEHIQVGNLIPIIGDEVLLIRDENGKEVKLMEYVFSILKRTYSVADELQHLEYSLKSMTVLKKIISEKSEFAREIRWIFKDMKLEERAYISDSLKSFLTIGDFPLIITTSCSNVLDTILKGYNSIYYGTEKRKNQDIGEINEDDPFERLEKKTIFHLFGSLSPGYRPVITEDDFLVYLHCLHDSNRHPEKLLQYVSKRRILTLGCEVPDWTFRFFLYSLKDVFNSSQSSNGFNGGVIESEANNDLAEFLSNIKYLYEGAGWDAFINSLNQLLQPIKKKSVFLSVISSDIAADNVFRGKILELKNSLKNNYKVDVWFCEDQLDGDSGEQYWHKIKEGLRDCTYFMPVLTPSLLLELNRHSSKIDIPDPLPDREPGIITEWKYAIIENKKRGSCTKYSLPYMISCGIEQVKDTLNPIKVTELRDLILGEEGKGLQIVDRTDKLSIE